MTPQDETLVGNHGDVVISGDRAWWFFFGGRLPGSPSSAPQAAPRRTTAINVLELSVVDGKLIVGDPARQTFIDLKPEREAEK